MEQDRRIPPCDALPSPRHRPRVALVAHGVHDQGGMERACAELIRRAQDRVAFTVVSAELSPGLRPLVEQWVHIKVPRWPFPLRFLVFFASAGRRLTSLDTDLVHTVGALVPTKADVASVHFCHAGHLAETGRLGPSQAGLVRRVNTSVARAFALVAERWVYGTGRACLLAAVSRGVLDELQTHYPGQRAVLTPNGVDTDRFRPEPDDRLAFRTELAVAPDALVALFVGGDWHHKGLSLAIDAVARTVREGVDLSLWVVGAGDQVRFSALAAELQIAAKVRFFGPRADTERFYRAADLFVLPSAYETFSLVCFEAAASGLPLVIPPLSGAGELVGDDTGGIIVHRRADSIAAALGALARDPQLRRRLGGEARSRASTFTWDASVQAVLALYRELLPTEPGTR